MNNSRRKPAWLTRRLPAGPAYEEMRALLAEGQLHTVCQEACCPNQFECFSNRTATFLILGDRCSRDCGFCAVGSDPQGPPDAAEPQRVAAAAVKLGLRYVVVTSVTRDDLPDGGAGHFAATIEALRTALPAAKVEVLIPDFQGDEAALATVLAARPDVLNHNIETVPRLYATVRPQAVYTRSLELLQRAEVLAPDIPRKSGLMLGLGEQPAEVRATLDDLFDAGVRRLTLGQYLQPSRQHLPVNRYVPPEEFAAWEQEARDMGFGRVASAPFVRSSYHAEVMG